MKLFRSDLEQFISNQLFEISTDDLNLNEIKVAGEKLSCIISVKNADNGYRVYGKLNTKITQSCDRCLSSFIKDFESTINILLSADETLISDKNIDVVRFKDSEQFVDLTSIIRELILLSEPFQSLCDKDCKGLCFNCGNNINKNKCNCHPSSSDSPWDSLKNLKNKKV